MRKAKDISNYTVPLTPALLQKWKDEEIDLLIVQAVDPSPLYPRGVTRVQIQKLLAAGFHVDAYVWVWMTGDLESDIRHKLSLLDGLKIRKLWLDVEDTSGGNSYDRIIRTRRALAMLDAYPTTLGESAGVYTGLWYWPTYMQNTNEFADRDLWDAHYDNKPDTEAGFAPYGGWTHADIKQYLGGQPDGTDPDVLSVEEAGELNPMEDTVLIPDDYVAKFSLADNHDVQGLIDHFEGVITTVREQTQAEDADCAARLQRVKEAVGA